MRAQRVVRNGPRRGVFVAGPNVERLERWSRHRAHDLEAPAQRNARGGGPPRWVRPTNACWRACADVTCSTPRAKSRRWRAADAVAIDTDGRPPPDVVADIVRLARARG